MTPLHELADALGIELLRPSAGGSFGAVPDETLLRLCRALGAAIERPADATDALAATYADRMRARIDPVTVAWDDDVPVLTLFRHPARRDGPFDVQVALESGTELVWTDRECRVIEVRDAHDGCVASSVALPRALPHGVHRVVVIDRAGDAAATIVAAPSRCGPERGAEWGLFAPLYALHDDVRPGTADFGTLRRFADWAASHGAALVGTLPLLATFLGHGDEPCDPSPYAPVSRQYWNEAYLDTSSIVEAQVAEPAAGLLVDLPAHAERLRRALEPVARATSTDPALARWLARRPDVTEYAQFRSKLEGVGEGGVRYHQFVQWQCERQLASLADDLAARGQSLYLDFPLGTHPDGFDVAREPELFVRRVSAGAPPDAFHNAGQNWGFPPIHPAAARRTGYAYLRACLDAHLRFARVLRLDHVMGLHRLWFVPDGAAATDGAYVRYAAEEQWAVISLLASRHDAQIVGEDLGTVTNAAREALVAHGALRMWVSQFDTPPHLPMDSPGAQHLAGTGTHDLPTFATWWAELDAPRRATLLATLQTAGTLPQSAAEPAPAAVLGALYAWMGNSDAPIVLAALEDLWLETEPQNRPGTQALENFRRRAAYGIDAFDTVAGLPEILARLDTARASARRSAPR
ncbi:MAG: 4-alpha-glucanotransferase [Acidimicrobiia bacterium]